MPKFICDKCDEQFKKKSQLNEHLLTHKKKDRQYECSKCDQVFKKKSKLVEHEATHKKKNRQYECSECDEIFSRKTKLEEHLMKHADQGYDCPFCGEIFSKKKLYEEHVMECEEEPVNIPQKLINMPSGFAPNQMIMPNYQRMDRSDPQPLASTSGGLPGFPSGVQLVPHSLPVPDILRDILNKPGALNNATIRFNFIFVDKDGIHLLKSFDATEYFKKKEQENEQWVEKKIDELAEIVVITRPKDIDYIIDDMSDFLNDTSRKKIKRIYKKYDLKDNRTKQKVKEMLKPIFYERKDEIIQERKLTPEQIAELQRKELEEIDAESDSG